MFQGSAATHIIDLNRFGEFNLLRDTVLGHLTVVVFFLSAGFMDFYDGNLVFRGVNRTLGSHTVSLYLLFQRLLQGNVLF